MCAGSSDHENQIVSDLAKTFPEIKFYPSYHPEAEKYIKQYPKIYEMTMKPDEIFWVSVIDQEFSDDGYFWMAFTEETGFNRNNLCMSAEYDGKWVTFIGFKTYDRYHIVKHNWLTNLLLKLKLIKVI